MVYEFNEVNRTSDSSGFVDKGYNGIHSRNPFASIIKRDMGIASMGLSDQIVANCSLEVSPINRANDSRGFTAAAVGFEDHPRCIEIVGTGATANSDSESS